MIILFSFSKFEHLRTVFGYLERYIVTVNIIFIDIIPLARFTRSGFAIQLMIPIRTMRRGAVSLRVTICIGYKPLLIPVVFGSLTMISVSCILLELSGLLFIFLVFVKLNS